MRPDLTKAPLGALMIAAAAYYTVIAAPSWRVSAAAAAIGLVAGWLVLRKVEPITGHAPTLTSSGTPQPGTVTLIDRDGVSHESLPYHRIAAVQVTAMDGHIATCSKMVSAPLPLRKVELDVDGDVLRLERRGARRIDVVTETGERLVTTERSQGVDGSSMIRAVAGNDEVVRHAALEDWSAPTYRSVGREGAIAQAVVLAGIEDQLRPLVARLMSAL